MVGDARQLHNYGFFFCVGPRSLLVHGRLQGGTNVAVAFISVQVNLAGCAMEKVSKNVFMPPHPSLCLWKIITFLSVLLGRLFFFFLSSDPAMGRENGFAAEAVACPCSPRVCCLPKDAGAAARLSHPLFSASSGSNFFASA